MDERLRLQRSYRYTSFITTLNALLAAYLGYRLAVGGAHGLLAYLLVLVVSAATLGGVWHLGRLRRQQQG